MAVSTMPVKKATSKTATPTATAQPTTSGQVAPAQPAAVPRTPPSWDIAQPTASRVGGISARQGAATAQPVRPSTITPPNVGAISAPSAYQKTPYTSTAQPANTIQNPLPSTGAVTPYGYNAENPAQYWSDAERAAALQEQMLGSEFFNYLNGGEPIYQGQVPLIEARLGYENQQLAERDRQLGYEELARSYGNIGKSTGEQAAMQAALQLVQSGGPYNAGYMDQQRGNLRDQSAMALEQARMAMAGDFARRGLGGSMLPQQQAQLAQQSSTALQGNLANLESSTALANQQAQLAATGQLSEMAYRESAQRQAIDQLLANIFLNTERQAPDLSNLLVDQSSGKKGTLVGK